MSIKERFQRFVSRKSLSSGHSSSSSSSNSDTCDTPPMPYASSSGTSTPISTTAHPPAAINPSPQDISTSLSNKTSPTSTSFLSKTLTWRSSHGEASSSPSSSAATATSTAKKERTKWGSGRKDRRNATAATGSAGAAARRRVHPSERPLTEANLRQQEALSAFKWEFGRSAGRRGSLGGWSVESGISPCCSRRPSLVPPPVA